MFSYTRTASSTSSRRRSSCESSAVVERDRRRHERRVVGARRETFGHDDIPDAHRAEQRPEAVGLAVRGEGHALCDELRAVGGGARPQVGDVGETIVRRRVGDPIRELPARERQNTGLAHPQDPECAGPWVVSHERQRRGEVAVRRAPPATSGRDERGDDADGERGRRRERRELSPSESVATEIDLECRDAEAGGESEADRGRGEQGVGRGQPDVDPPSGGRPRERERHCRDRPGARGPTESPASPDHECERADDEERPAEWRRAERAGLEAKDLSERERTGARRIDRREARPVGAGRLNTPSDHGRFSTNAITDAPTATPSARNAPRHPPASTLASTRHNAVIRTRTTTKGTIATATATTRPRPSTSDFHVARWGRANGASPLARARRDDHPGHHRIGDEAVPAPVAERVVRQRDRRVRDERGDAGPHRRRWSR